jgi:hypothetical protein
MRQLGGTFRGPKVYPGVSVLLMAAVERLPQMERHEARRMCQYVAYLCTHAFVLERP